MWAGRSCAARAAASTTGRLTVVSPAHHSARGLRGSAHGTPFKRFTMRFYYQVTATVKIGNPLTFR